MEEVPPLLPHPTYHGAALSTCPTLDPAPFQSCLDIWTLKKIKQSPLAQPLAIFLRNRLRFARALGVRGHGEHEGEMYDYWTNRRD